MQLLLAFALARSSNCIDVGSNQGRVLADMLRFAPEGSHIAYEPLPVLHEQLTLRFPGVDVRKVALSDADGSSSFLHVKNLPEYSGLRRRAYPAKPNIELIEVLTERLDGHLPEHYVPDLIKIDVEGAEQLVIEGAMQTLKTHQPIVLFEHGRGAAEYYGASPTAIYHLLCDLAGLRIFDLDGNGPYSSKQFAITFERNDRWNFVAHR